MNLFTKKLVPLDIWVQQFVEPLALALRPAFQAAKWPFATTLGAFEASLIAIPHSLFRGEQIPCFCAVLLSKIT